MRINKTTKSILQHIFNQSKFDLSEFSDSEIPKLRSILEKVQLSLEEFCNREEFTSKEKGKLLISLIMKGIDVQVIFELLDWKGFEIVVSALFDEFGYSVISNFRFKDEFTKYEIDVLAYKFPFLFLIDCKHYKSPSSSIMKDAVIKQRERTEVLIEVFPISSQELISKLSLPMHREIFLYPLIISWKDHNLQFYDNVPIVPFNHLQGFLQEIDEYRFNLYHLSLKLS